MNQCQGANRNKWSQIQRQGWRQGCSVDPRFFQDAGLETPTILLRWGLLAPCRAEMGSLGPIGSEEAEEGSIRPISALKGLMLDFFIVEKNEFREGVIAIFKYSRGIGEKMKSGSPQQCTARGQGATVISCKKGNPNGK
ncbi:hypothetical protein llap_4394 [Limosa lapponica baueri]|uniref:Uncharacterized protein n=1 Tax=Limosa lapponica baueri TaxID=1758121 RepID=A0A2I0UGW8_LIMLA|nr:hypothetical protein llap_4394 [Limosa lapponica baueri]